MGLSSDETDKTEGLAQKRGEASVSSVSSDDLKADYASISPPVVPPGFCPPPDVPGSAGASVVAAASPTRLNEPCCAKAALNFLEKSMATPAVRSLVVRSAVVISRFTSTSSPAACAFARNAVDEGCVGILRSAKREIGKTVIPINRTFKSYVSSHPETFL